MARVTSQREEEILQLIREGCSACTDSRERYQFLSRIESYCMIRSGLEGEPPISPIHPDLLQFEPPPDPSALDVAKEIAHEAVSDIGVRDLFGVCNYYRDLAVVDFFGPPKEEIDSARANRLMARMSERDGPLSLRFVEVRKDGGRFVEDYDRLAQRCLKRIEIRRSKEAAYVSLKHELGKLKKPLTWGQVFGAYLDMLVESADKHAIDDQRKALGQLLSPRRHCWDCRGPFEIGKYHPHSLLCPRCVNKRKQRRHRARRASERKTLRPQRAWRSL
ncbi:MAG: hypothetical protein QUS33_04705 [Dehalococcoidia bacterium]|nr:hypothetical protein [Dehalococcoidia bacterium]